MRKNKIIIVCLLLIVSCKMDDKTVSYIEKNKYVDYSKFKNKKIFIRDYDINGNPTIFVQDTRYLNNICSKQYIVIYDMSKGQIAEINDQIPDTCNIDDEINKEVAVFFAKDNILNLMVDSYSNIFVSINSNETFDIIKVNDLKSYKRDYGDIDLSIYEVYKEDWFIKKKH